MAIKGLFICDLETRIKREFLIVQKVLSSQKTKRVFLNWNVLCSQRFLGQTLAYSNKELWLIFIVQSVSFKRDFFFFSFYFWKGVKRSRVSCCKGFLNTREGLSLCDSDFVKDFTKRVENLKWVAWGLDVGTGSDQTSINQVCISLFP